MSGLTQAAAVAAETTVASALPVGLVLSAFAFGLRHGFDWDHIAAIADLSGSTTNRRRGLSLSMLYAVGHGVVVLAIGLVIVVVGSAVTDRVGSTVDTWMGRVVGITLFGLGLWILIELVRKGRDFRLQSRWMLVLHGTFAGLRRVHRSLDRVTKRQLRHVELQHSHPHNHVDDAHDDRQAHDHSHVRMDSDIDIELDTQVAVAAKSAGHDVPGRPAPTISEADSGGHSHSHSHSLTLGDIGGGTAVGVGVLHGVGIESPTQIAIFTASTAVDGGAAAVALLVAWVTGLIVANGVLAVAAGFGLLHAQRYFAFYAALAVIVALLSMAMGLALIVDFELPGLFVVGRFWAY